MSKAKNWMSLASAIVEQSVLDYYDARFFLDTINLRSFKGEAEKESAINKNERMIMDVKKFLMSQWYTELCPTIPGGLVWKEIQRTYCRDVVAKRFKKARFKSA